MRKQYILILLAAALIMLMPSCKKTTVYKALIITGQSGHNRETSSEAVKQILDETGMFSCVISGFTPDFSKYKLVVLDYGGDMWSEEVNADLMDYVNNGGGIVIFNSKSDPGAAIPDSVTVSERHSFEVWTAVTDHPVTKGLPLRWLHPDDEIVQGLKPAGEDVQVLAVAFSDTSFSGTGRMEPVLVARNYGKGRIFATLIGSPDEKENLALHCAGLIVTLQRGAEWAATGNVTQEVPFDFPTAAGAVLRPDFKRMTLEEAFKNIANYDIKKSTKYFTFIQDQLRKAAGDEKTLSDLEKKMVDVLKTREASDDAKKLLLRELSWMGSDYCIPAIKALSSDPDLQDDVEFALTRLQK
ncbi:MAG: ThuA domain-containing protein [Bacteroidia bacterium]|nr:ThuA domain-containing protein [Bacteroidia bacterium]